MLRSYRYIGLAIGVAILSIAPSASTHNQGSKKTEATEQQKPPASPVAATDHLKTAKQSNSYSESQDDSKDAISAAVEANILAEEANAISEQSLLWTRLGAGLTIVGLGFVWWSLHQSRRDREHEFRAYVRITDISGTIVPTKKAELITHAVNYGRTPALDVRIFSKAYVKPSEWWWDFDATSVQLDDGKTAPIHPDEPKNIVITTDESLTETDTNSAFTGQSSVFFRVWCSYKDVFGKSHETVVGYEFTGADCARLGKVRLSAKDNKAT